MEIEVKGHSGCQIDIVRENNDLFIYKSSADKKYLARLVKQAEKQIAASKTEYQHIRIPQIYDVKKSVDSVNVKMEYVYSKNFIEFFESAGFEQINYFVRALILFLDQEIKSSQIQAVETSVVVEKFNDVLSKVSQNPLLNSDREVAGLMEKSRECFYNLQNISMPVGVCHGDLTFSNILFNGNNYYLIDFLDSFIESPLLDVVKIRQDSAFLWSQLMYVKSYDRIRLEIICKKIDDAINEYFKKYDWYHDFYGVFQLMNMLRILQYAKEEKVINYLKQTLQRILYEI